MSQSSGACSCAPETVADEDGKRLTQSNEQRSPLERLLAWITVPRVLGILGSRRLATSLIVSWMALLVIWVIPFHFYGLPTEQIKRIVYGEPFFQGVYIGLIVVTAGCIGLRIRSIYLRIRRNPSPNSTPRLPEQSPSLECAWDDERSVEALRSCGFRHVVLGTGWAWGVRNRFAPVGNLVSHFAFLIMLVAVVVAARDGSAFVGNAVVAEGETFATADGQFTDIYFPEAERPRIEFTLRSFDPRFHEDILLFTRLAGVISDRSGRTRDISLASPWIIWPDTVVAVEDFGYAAEVTARSREGTSPAPAVHKLKVFPSSMEDSFDVQGVGDSDYRVHVRVFGDYVDRGGKPGVKSFNLSNPRVQVRVTEVLSTKAELQHVSSLVSLGEPITVPDGTIVIEAIRLFGVFRIARFDAAPWVLLALVVASVGFAMRLLWPRQEALIVSQGATTVVSVLDETYRAAPRIERRLLESLARDAT